MIQHYSNHCSKKIIGLSIVFILIQYDFYLRLMSMIHDIDELIEFIACQVRPCTFPYWKLEFKIQFNSGSHIYVSWRCFNSIYSRYMNLVIIFPLLIMHIVYQVFQSGLVMSYCHVQLSCTMFHTSSAIYFATLLSISHTYHMLYVVSK